MPDPAPIVNSTVLEVVLNVTSAGNVNVSTVVQQAASSVVTAGDIDIIELQPESVTETLAVDGANPQGSPATLVTMSVQSNVLTLVPTQLV
jgi:hypothetical protein